MEEVASAVAAVGSEEVRSYFRAKDDPSVDRSLQCLEKELLLSKGHSMHQQTLGH